MENVKSTTYDKVNKVWLGYKSSYPYAKDTYVGEKIIESLKSDPDRLLQISHDEQKYLYAGEFLTSITRIAQNLINLGIKPNDVVGIVCLNSTEKIMMINACILIGAPINTLDPFFITEEISHMFNQTQPKLILCDCDVYLKVKSSLINIKNKSTIFTIGEKSEHSFEKLLTPTGMENEFVSPKFEESAFDKILGIVCSSGTSGPCKGVCLSHGRIFLRYFSILKNATPTRSLIFSTAYWVSGFYACVTVGLLHKDVRILTKQRYSDEIAAEIVDKYQVSRIVTWPLQLQSMIQCEKLVKNHSSLKTIVCSGSMVTTSLREKFKESFPVVKLRVSYGMSEYAVILSNGDQNDTSVGNTLIANNEVIIVDDDGNRLGVGEAGEIRIKNSIKFLGYYGNSEATADAVDNEGFFKTGDIGYFDDDNQLYVIDRKKDIFKYQGVHCNPSEIESVIEQIEGVKMVCVVGIPDGSHNDLCTAVIVRQNGYEEKLTEKTVKKFVESQLPVTKQLHGGVIFVNEIPMTASGKVQRKKVREIIMKNKNHS